MEDKVEGESLLLVAVQMEKRHVIRQEWPGTEILWFH